MRHTAQYRLILTTNILLLIQGQKERAATTNTNTKSANTNTNTMSPRRRSDPEWSWKSKSLISLEPLVRHRFIASITSSFKSDKHHAVRDEAKRMLRLAHNFQSYFGNTSTSPSPLWPFRWRSFMTFSSFFLFFDTCDLKDLINYRLWKCTSSDV